jgi:UDP-N-acetyl-D-galactosamine dehydrogenase
LAKEIANDYDAVIVAVPHAEYGLLDDNYFAGISKPYALVADLKGIFKSKITSRTYWSL